MIAPPVLHVIPAIDGLTFRSLRNEEDAQALYAVHTGRIARDGIDLSLHNEDFPSFEGFRQDVLSTIAERRQDQWLVAHIDEFIAGYSQLASWHEEDGVWVYFIGGWVLPEWRGKGIGTAMLHWGEAIACQLASAEHPNERFEFAANASCTENEAAALLSNEGYYIAFTTLEMQFDNSTILPAPPTLPEGIGLRPVLTEHYPAIINSIIECYQDAFPGNRFRSTFDRMAYFNEEWKKPKYDPKLWYVAWDGDQVAGQVFLVIENGQVYVSQVSVRQAWRRKGIARALLIRALWDARKRGEEMIWLDTFAEYQTHAVNLYRELGFQVVKAYRRYRKTPV